MQSRWLYWLHWLTLITGLIVGVLFAVSWEIYNLLLNVGDDYHRSYNVWSANDAKINGDHLNYVNMDSLESYFASDDEMMMIPDENMKTQMNSIKLTCLIQVKKSNILSTLNQTWASRCNQSFFYFSSSDLPDNSTLPNVDNIALISGSSSRLFFKSKLSSWKLFCSVLLKTNFIKSQYSSADWFLIAPSNVLFIIENLRRYLISFNSSNQFYLGLPYNNHAPINYNSFDSGIVLSRAAFNSLMEVIKLTNNCNSNYLSSKRLSLDRRMDVAIGQILNTHGVEPLDTRDKLGRARFLGLSLDRHIFADDLDFDHPFWQHNVYHFPNGPNCCSDHLISIPDSSMRQIRFYYYLMYQVRVNGRLNPLTGRI
ncbi:glycoprotein-N-acetylgalactosamine 3-beta-galactosyltransferase 1-like [Panonychus citri]|uniref:glycoprotein-N-acetylgalactosamine 3-beta-galactosyltransferase 1-like n=1 Tax=Panonychus citri TaxID=50023 RepID=UPI002307CFE3|nr:glycoprotein-N-acetylgalactosamine 3-beta-galactosyltransferase 1-like [Panonychus citri]